jgi:hypothetical protein
MADILDPSSLAMRAMSLSQRLGILGSNPLQAITARGMNPAIGGAKSLAPKASPVSLAQATVNGPTMSPKTAALPTSSAAPIGGLAPSVPGSTPAATPWSASKAGSAMSGGGPGPIRPPAGASTAPANLGDAVPGARAFESPGMFPPMDTSSAMRAYSGQGPFQDQIKSLASSEVSPDALARAHEEVPLGGPGLLTQALHNSMNADQLNMVYRQHNLGGDASSSNAIAGALTRANDEAFRTPSLAAATQSLADAAPKSPDAPSVLGTPQVQPGSGPQGMEWGLPGHNSDPAIQAMHEAVQNANWWNNPEGVATLGNALANYRGAMGSNRAQEIGAQAHMLGAQADMQRAMNPLGGYMNPVGLQMLDAQAGGTGNVIGAAQAGGIGLGPHGAISPQGMKTYFQSKHPEFANLIGNKDATLDQFRDIYNRTRARFAEGDAQLAELNSSLGQALPFMFSPDDMEAASNVSWMNPRRYAMAMGLADDGGAGQTAQFLHNTGLR